VNEQPLSPACEAALAAFQHDPLELPAEVEAHLRICTACAEARIVLLAQEEAPTPLVPAGYFERLPGRVLGKLPQRRQPMLLRPWMLASAAALLLAVGGISFMAGRANPTEAVAAAELKPHEARSIQKSTLPFHDAPDNLGTLQEMSPEEAAALVEQLENDPPRRSE
jgi:hypothetical protein